MIRRAILTALGLASILVLLAGHSARAASDLYANIGPGLSVSGLADRYPIGNYALDQHFTAVKASLTGGVDASGIPPMIAFFLANLLWQLTAFVANALITVFAFAFGLDLLNGSAATGGAGALAPVGDAIAGLYAHTFGQPWMVIAITLAGCWAMWRALIQRRYTETAGALTVSLVFCLIALAVVARPDATIGTASRWSNQLSAAFLSVTAHGDVATGDSARRAAGDQLFALLVLRPWVALNFGGTEHCIRTATGSQDHDPTSVAVRPLPADAARTLQARGQVTSAGKQCVSNTGRYAAHFLGFAPGSEDRDREYDAVNDADPSQLPDADPAKTTGAYPAVVDKPVSDAMEQGGQYQRLLLALLVLVGELGAFLLLGALALSVVLSQVVVLLLACFSPVALVAGIIPGRGHDLFRTWASHMADVPGAQGRLLARARGAARRPGRAAGRHQQPRVADELRPAGRADVDRVPATPAPRRPADRRGQRPAPRTRSTTAPAARPPLRHPARQSCTPTRTRRQRDPACGRPGRSSPPRPRRPSSANRASSVRGRVPRIGPPRSRGLAAQPSARPGAARRGRGVPGRPGLGRGRLAR